MLNCINILCLIVLISFVQCLVTTKIHNFLTDWLERKKELDTKRCQRKDLSAETLPRTIFCTKIKWGVEVPEFARYDTDMLQKEQLQLCMSGGPKNVQLPSCLLQQPGDSSTSQLCTFVRLYKNLCILYDPNLQKFIHGFVSIVVRNSSYTYLQNVDFS